MHWGYYVIGGLAVVIVLSVIMHFVNRRFRVEHGYNLAVGGLFTLFAVGLCVLGIVFIKDGTIGYLLIAAAVAVLIIIAIVCVKKCGAGAGIAAFFLQILFCVPALIMLLDLKNNRHYAVTSSRETRKVNAIRRERERDYYD